MFFVYLLKPLTDFLNRPFSCSCVANLCENRLNVRRAEYRYRRAKKDPEEEEIHRLLVSMNMIGSGHDSAITTTTVSEPCRKECRCPYWLAVIVALCFVSALLSALVLLVIGSLQV